MAELLTVAENVDGWNSDGDNVSLLVKDETTGQHYVLSTVTMPWQDSPETMVYATNEKGDPESVENINAFFAGGLGMTQEDALADLSARLDEDRPVTDDEVKAAIERDYESFMRWVSEKAAALA